MLVIKPYGRSQTRVNNTAELAQREWLKANQSQGIDVALLADQAAFLIAHWIAVIDKIITKPNSKSGQNAKATQEQYHLRERLGRAAWELLQKEPPIKADRDALHKLWQHKLHPYSTQTFADTPAPNKPWGTASTPSHNKAKPPQRTQGRLYAYFVGPKSTPASLTDDQAREIAQRIQQHLMGQALKARNASNAGPSTAGEGTATTRPRAADKRTGFMANQLHSIAENVHQIRTGKDIGQAHPPQALQEYEHIRSLLDEANWRAYFAHGDVVQTIFKAAHAGKPSVPGQTHAAKPATSGKNAPAAQSAPRVALAAVAQLLFAHYAKVFGENTKVREVLDDASHPQHLLMQLHLAIKAAYKTFFDNARAKGKQHLAKHLPNDQAAMQHLLAQRAQNRDVNHLIRLGKVIHYEAAWQGQGVDDLLQQDAQTLGKSRFWLSAGQAEIKRHEALVRVFKLTIAHAAQSFTHLTQWFDGDVLLNANDACTTVEAHHLAQHLPRLLGQAQGCLPSAWGQDGQAAPEMRELLRQSIESWAQMRHASFHFKGREGFLNSLRASLQKLENMPQLDNVANDLWQRDWQGCRQRVAKTLEAAHALTYLTPAQLQAVHNAVVKDRTGVKPSLPRLNRVLTRAENIRKNINPHDPKASPETVEAAQAELEKLALPPTPKREELEQTAWRRCQYVLLKLLYEQDFAGWLENLGGREFNKMISQAIARANQAAQDLNKRDGVKNELVRAKVGCLWTQQSGQSNGAEGWSALQTFLEKLSAETASEFQVQRHYASDGESAREQAAFIEDFKCEVLARALRKYLKQKWPWLLEMAAAPPTHAAQLSDLNELHTNSTTQGPDPMDLWQQRLYFLLHFVPVGVVSQLLHQLQKWDVLQSKAAALNEAHAQPNHDTQVSSLYPQCAQVMVLYLDMHDAKFDGGTPLQLEQSEREQLQACFEQASDFAQCMPAAPGSSAEPDAGAGSSPPPQHVPLRALREMLRFGSTAVLQAVFAAHRISHQECQDWLRLNQDGPHGIQAAQQQREELHREWINKRKGFTQTDAYRKHLEICTQHRQLAHRVRLVDHVQLHGLMMAVLARLTDYAGLWERDLYFVSLALMQQAGKGLPEVFKESGKNKFLDGQVPKALENRLAPNSDCLQALEQLFNFKSVKDIRNDLSHFNMLQSTKPNTKGAGLNVAHTGVSKPLNAFETPNLTHWVNQTRRLMAYDRKLKNAVSKSIIELLAREGFELRWNELPSGVHDLGSGQLRSSSIEHLGGKTVQEPHHSIEYCGMVRDLFFEKTPNQAFLKAF